MYNTTTNNSRSVRVRTDLLSRLGALYEGQTNGVNRFIAFALKARENFPKSIFGKFSREELTGLVASQNGVMITPQFWGQKWAIIHQLQDFENLEQGISTHGADFDTLLEKIQGLTDLEMLFLHEEIYRFWNEAPAYGAPNPDMEKFLSLYCPENKD